MAAYLATASVGNYDLEDLLGDERVPIIDAADKDFLPTADDGPSAEQMLVYFESLFGPYPFVSYGAIVDDDRSATRSRPRPGRSTRDVLGVHGAH